MIMELGVLLPVFLIPPEVVINLSLSCMGLMFIVGGILMELASDSPRTVTGTDQPSFMLNPSG